MRTPADARSWARLTYDRRVFTWLALCSSRADADIDLSLPLHPPAASTALGEGATVGDWIRAWAGAALPAGCEVMWEERRWRALGAQRVPTALKVKTASAAAELGGRAKDWAMLTERLAAIRCALTAADVVGGLETGVAEAGVAEAGVAEAGVAEATAAMARAMKSCARDLRQADVADFSRALEVTRWLVLNPDSGLYVRQLPIAGVDTKWVDHHRRLIVALLTGARDLAGLPGEGRFGCAPMPHPRAVVIADPALRPAGLRYFLADEVELAELWDAATPPESKATARPRLVLVVENKQSLLAVPDFEGVVALHGGGYAVDWIGKLPWASDLPVVYWGDLDEDGLLILHRLRHHHGHVRSVMMDAQTFTTFRELAVPDPHQPSDPPSSLTAEERLAWECVHAGGGLRLEQERINWSWAVDRLEAALDQGYGA